MQKLAEFSILPIVYSSQATHYLYIRAHAAKAKPESDLPPDKTLFLVNLPPDATERDLITLFSKVGTVERVVFGGYNHSESLADDTDSEDENADEIMGEEDEVQEIKQSKKEAAPKVIPLPTASLRLIRRTGGTGHIVFTSSAAIKAALSLSGKDLPLSWPKFKATSTAEPSGLAHYLASYHSRHPPLSSIKEHADSSMEVFEYKQALASKRNSKYKKGEAIVDEDGFTLVTRGGAYGQTLGGGVGVASKKFMQDLKGGKRHRKKKETSKEGFYAFQLREKRIQGMLTVYILNITLTILPYRTHCVEKVIRKRPANRRECKED